MWFRFSDLSEELQDIARKEFDDVGTVRDEYFYEVSGNGIIMWRSLDPDNWLKREDSKTMKQILMIDI